MELKRRERDKNMPSIFLKEVTEELLRYKKVMISKHFSSALTRAVGEICKDEKEDMIEPPMMVSRSGPIDPALEFIKAVLAILELDSDVDEELHILKRSLLAQVGVPEYSSLAKWVNPCPTFILPGVFCAECHESRDINLCYVPPPDEEEEGQPVSVIWDRVCANFQCFDACTYKKCNKKSNKLPCALLIQSQIHWYCEDCGDKYDVDDIERRLIQHVNSKMLRYQMQDLRCAKSNRVATTSLACVSDYAASWNLDIPQDDSQSKLETLYNLAEYHQLEGLKETMETMLHGF